MLIEANPLIKDISEIESFFNSFSDFMKNRVLEEITDSKITCLQFSVLSFLNENVQITVNDIVKTQKVSYSACTSLLDNLVSLELIERKRSDSDRRLVYVFITEKGQKAVVKVINRRNEIIKQLFENLNAEEMLVIKDSFAILKKKLNILEAI